MQSIKRIVLDKIFLPINLNICKRKIYLKYNLKFSQPLPSKIVNLKAGKYNTNKHNIY